jgi:acyl carrier protein
VPFIEFTENQSPGRVNRLIHFASHDNIHAKRISSLSLSLRMEQRIAKSAIRDWTGRYQMTAHDAAENTAKADQLHHDGANTDLALKSILSDVLGLDKQRVASFSNETGLFGHLPELDSMAVAGLLTEVEDRLHILIEDDDVDGEMLETYGGLLAFVEAKVSQA